jgi:HlyD family type I secretion membrane fusion protein
MNTESISEVFVPVKSDEFLPPISLWSRLGGLLLVGTFGVAVTIASITKYNVTVKAPATVRPTGELRIVQAQSEGTVKSIAVKENEIVKQGAAIATIDSSQLQTKKIQLRNNIQNSLLQLQEIASQIKSLASQGESESQLMNRTIASAQADLNLNKREYKEKQISTKAEVKEAEASLELAQEELKRYQQLAKTGAIAQLQIKEKEQAYKIAIAKLQRTAATLNPSNATLTVATERIAQERARGESTLATLNKQRQELVERQVEIQNKISSDQKELEQVATDLQKAVIRTSQSGTILKLELRNPGQVVRLGDAIATIAPSNAPLVIKARVSVEDIAKVQVCKVKKITDCQQGKVLLRVSAYPYPDYGTLLGAVRSVSVDVVKPENTVSIAPAVPYYEVTVESDRLYLHKGNQSYFIQPGMEVTADIIAKEETVLTFILRKARLLTNV